MYTSFCGKTIENIRNRLNLHLIDNPDAHRRLNPQSKLSFDDKIAEHEKIKIYSFFKEQIKNSEPIYVRLCVLQS